MNSRVAAEPLRVLGLRGIRLFDGLDACSLEEIARQCCWRGFKRNERVISRRATDCDVYLVIAGTLRVTARSLQGRGMIFRDISAGGLFGELSALDQGARSADVIAVTEAVLASMSPETFQGVLTQYPGVRQRLFRSLAALVRELTERLLELSTMDVEHRVAVELLRRVRAAGVSRNASRVQPTPTHLELAERVGTSREQVTRTLLGFSRRGIIMRDRRRVLLVPDVASLEKFAGERAHP